MAGQKRGSIEVEDILDLPQKRVKMRDLESVFRSEGIDTHYPKSWKHKQSLELSHSADKEMSQVTEETMKSDASGSGRMRNDTLKLLEDPAFTALDLNAKVDLSRNFTIDNARACVEKTKKTVPDSGSNIEKSRGFRLDLNAEDVSSSVNNGVVYSDKHDQLKLRDDMECGSTCGPLEEKDPMKVWKEMKQNGFMSSCHGGLPASMPKPRGRKTKADGLKKKMEIARREQVDRFAKVAAPSGLLSGLNPGIINHVRNRKQVHSIIEALVRSARHVHRHTGNRHEDIQIKTEPGNLNWPGKNRSDSFHQNKNLYTLSGSRGTIDCTMSSEHIEKDNDNMVEDSVFNKSTCVSYSNLENEEDVLALKLSSSATMASDNMSCLSNELSGNLTSVSSLSVKAANVASQFLELLQQDIKGRLAALRRSKKRVEAIIQTELPFLLSREFSGNQGNDPYLENCSVTGSSDYATAEMHKTRWNSLFNQMDKSLSEEEKQLESWLNQVKEMQLQCDRGLSHCIGVTGMQQLGTLEIECRLKKADGSERDLAVRAAAAAFYSTCNFLQPLEDLPCFC